MWSQPLSKKQLMPHRIPPGTRDELPCVRYCEHLWTLLSTQPCGPLFVSSSFAESYNLQKMTHLVSGRAGCWRFQSWRPPSVSGVSPGGCRNKSHAAAHCGEEAIGRSWSARSSYGRSNRIAPSEKSISYGTFQSDYQRLSCKAIKYVTTNSISQA